MKLARLVLVMFLMAVWAMAQSGASAASNDSKKADSAAEHKHAEQAGMSCGCCKDMAKKDGMKTDGMSCAKMDKDKDAAKSESGMGCCAKMGKDGAAGGMSCGKKDDGAKPETPEQKMK